MLGSHWSEYVFDIYSLLHFSGEGPKAHLRRLAECIRWSYGAGIVLRLGNIARLELNYCIPMGVQSGDRYGIMLGFYQIDSTFCLKIILKLNTQGSVQ